MTEQTECDDVGGVRISVGGKKWDAWSDAERIDYLRRLAGSLNQALDVMQSERDAALAEIEALRKKCSVGEQAFETQKMINLQVITENNERMQRDGEELRKLRSEVRRLTESEK
jgi:hypothetical protein